MIKVEGEKILQGAKWILNRPLEVVFGITQSKEMEESIVDSERLFSQAKKNIRIVSGRLNHQFYNDTRIVNALKKAIENNVSVEIICGPYTEVDKESKEILDLYKQGNIEIWELNKHTEGHFSVVDERHAKYDYHCSYDDKKSSSDILRRTIATGNKLTREYLELKQQAKPLHFSEAA